MRIVFSPWCGPAPLTVVAGRWLLAVLLLVVAFWLAWVLVDEVLAPAMRWLRGVR